MLITNYAMNGMNGVELARLARKRPSFACIVVSGVPKPPDAPSSLQWVPKPVELERLLGAMMVA